MGTRNAALPVSTVAIVSPMPMTTITTVVPDSRLAERELGRRHPDQRSLGCLWCLGVEPGCPGQELGSELTGARKRQERERRLARTAARHLEPQLGQARDAGDQWADDVDGLQAVELDLPGLAEQHAGLHLQDVADDAVPREPPVQVAVRERDRASARTNNAPGSRTAGPPSASPGNAEPNNRPSTIPVSWLDR